MSEVECGAACLAMILNYYGRKTRLAECREVCGIGRDGVTAYTITHAAGQYGLRVKAVSLEPEQLAYVPLPAIAHWTFNHFVVVERWSPKAVVIVDPAAGRRRLTAAEFDAGFTGVVIALEPGVHFAPRRVVDRPAWRIYLRSMLNRQGVPSLLAQVLAASVCLQLLGLALPVVTKVLVDHVLPLQITGVMPILGIGLVVLVLTQTVTGYLRGVLLLHLQVRLDAHLMLGFFEHVLALPVRFFQVRSSGDLLMRLGSNVVIRELLTSQTLAAVLDGTLVLSYLMILFVRAPLLGLLVLGSGLLQVLLLRGTTRWMHGLIQRDLAAQAESHSYLLETLSGITTVKASGTEERALDHWSNLFFHQLNLSLHRGHVVAIVDTVIGALRTGTPLIVLWLGTLQVLEGATSLGTMLALNGLAIALLVPLASLITTGQRLQMVGAHLERLADVARAEPEQDMQVVHWAPQLSGRIELQQVGFRFDANAPHVLRDISVTIEPGQTVALVGRTGSGKSTLAMLLLGLYTPTEGDILYDDVPLHRLHYRTLRRQCGVVLQDAFLFSGSIRQNIAFNDPGLSLEQIMQAAQLAAIDDEITPMPMGYETRIGEGGNGLSGGQRQRVALARALAHRPAILVLDEATSHLDVVTEEQVDRNLSRLSCTRIVVAHRLSTIRNADLILVLNDGTIVERGTHEELLRYDGQYAALVHSQLVNEAGEEPSAMPVYY